MMPDPKSEKAESDVESDPHVAGARDDTEGGGSYVGQRRIGGRLRCRRNRR